MAFGFQNTAGGFCATVFGLDNKTYAYGQFTHGAADLRSQVSRFDLYATNNGMTSSVVLSLDGEGGTYPLVLRDGWTIAGTINVLVVNNAAATEVAHYIRKFAATRNQGNSYLLGTPSVVGTDLESLGEFNISIAMNGHTLEITVTAPAGVTEFNAAAVVDVIELCRTNMPD